MAGAAGAVFRRTRGVKQNKSRVDLHTLMSVYKAVC